MASRIDVALSNLASNLGWKMNHGMEDTNVAEQKGPLWTSIHFVVALLT